MFGKRVLFCLALLVFFAGATGQAMYKFGQVANYLNMEGINGVTVTVFDHSYSFNQITHTDAALADSEGYTSPDGMFFFANLPEVTDWWMSIVVPEGWELAVDPSQPPEWNSNPRYVNCNVQTDFYLVPETTPPTFCPRTIGFWKHQATVSVTGQGHAQVPPEELEDLFEAIYDQFDDGEYFPIEGVSSVDDEPLTAEDALVTFNLPNGGPQGMINKAKKQLLGLLLNVVAEYVSLDYLCSADDQTVEEAIAFIADQISSNGEDLETAKNVADYINNGMEVPEGWIPDGYENIHYGPRPPTGGLAAAIGVKVYPNPFNPTTAISYQLLVASQVSLKVYDTAGRLVATLVDGWRDAGTHQTTFDGTNLTSGVYLFRVQSNNLQTTGKLLLVK